MKKNALADEPEVLSSAEHKIRLFQNIFLGVPQKKKEEKKVLDIELHEYMMTEFSFVGELSS